jgi:beta-galactosidase GanA
MKTSLLPVSLAVAACLAFPGLAPAAPDATQPHLETRHGVRQLVVDGQPFLMLSGELHNSSTSSKEYMKPIWPQLARRNLNTVLAVITWELIEPQPGHFDFTTVDDTIQGARDSHLRLVILWFGSWKNGESSYQPAWVKADPQRYPWAKDRAGKTLNLLSTFGDATRDADARAFAALMRHLREVDGKEHTVLAMQVENEVGVLGDSRDFVPAANDAFAKPVPKELMNYLVQHQDTLAPELKTVWAANGNKPAGTWAEVFGPGKPDSAKNAAQLSQDEKDTLWRQFDWPVDEIFMAWRYSTYINKVAAAGKAEYNIPYYCNTWLQQPGTPRPGEFPSGCPEPEVHDVWRAGAPNIDILAPDIYIPQFEEVCQRYTRNGNPLLIPEAASTPDNALLAVLKYNAMCFSPFGIEGRGGFNPQAAPGVGAATPDSLAQTYAILGYLAPVILENQGRGTITRLPAVTDTNAPPQELKLGDYTLHFAYGAPNQGGGRRGGGGGPRAYGPYPPVDNNSPARLVINSAPGEYYLVGGPMRVSFTANQPDRGDVVLGSFDETMYVDGHWVPGRRLNGDETSDNRNWPALGSFGIYRYSVFQRQ